MPCLRPAVYRAGQKLVETMLDVFYVVIGILFFLLLWAFTRACERL